MNITSTTKLNNGIEMPTLGFGVFLSPPGDETKNAVRWAIEAGYIHLDTATVYENEQDVGNAIKESGVAREKLFVTTKLWNSDMRANRQLKAFDESLERLQMDYVDLYLVHWPVENFVESYLLLEEIYASGKAKAIGVSNFQTHHMDKLLAKAKIVPAVNQIELHPYLTQETVRKYCAEKGIVIEAWSPIGGQGNDVLQNPVITGIASKYGKSAAQVIIRWHLQQGIVVIPKSVRKPRIEENRNVFDFELTADEIAAIAKLNINRRNGGDPDNFDF